MPIMSARNGSGALGIFVSPLTQLLADWLGSDSLLQVSGVNGSLYLIGVPVSPTDFAGSSRRARGVLPGKPTSFDANLQLLEDENHDDTNQAGDPAIENEHST